MYECLPIGIASAMWTGFGIVGIEIIEDREKVYDIARQLSRKFTGDEAYIDEIKNSGPCTLMFALTIEHMTGKLVSES